MQNPQISLEETKDHILNILKEVSGSRADIAYEIYGMIARCSGHEAEALAFFYEYSEDIESSEEHRIEKVFSEEDKYQFTSQYGKMIDGFLEALLRENLPGNTFYAKLWEFINNDGLLVEKKQKAFALYYIWIDVRIPYYQLQEGIKMSNEDYQAYNKDLKETIKKARFILFTPTAQKTERASRLLDLLDEVDDKREKAVLMSHILRMNNRNDVLARLLRRKEQE